MQTVVIELLQPVFRKDEESAWTVIQSRPSTRRPVSSIFTGSNRSSLQVQNDGENHSRRFTFENDLILAPVYKRMLFRCLSAPETIKSSAEPEGQEGVNPRTPVERTKLVVLLIFFLQKRRMFSKSQPRQMSTYRQKASSRPCERLEV